MGIGTQNLEICEYLGYAANYAEHMKTGTQAKAKTLLTTVFFLHF